MQYALALAALAGAALAAPQGVTAVITPSAPAPTGCSPSFSGKFQIQTVNVTTASKKLRIRQDLPMNQPGGPLIITLADGVLTDAQGRTGYIASNEQLQFDGPPQDGAIYTAGFSACSNSTLALGGTTIFYQCPTSNYFNLYDSSVAPQCSPVYIQLLPYSGPTGATELTDGQPGVTSAVSQISDGQPQATGAVTTPISVISDGQPQATGAVSEISDGQPQVSGAASTPAPAPVTQISDGQIQATTPAPAPITQISDGQIQAPTTPVSPISQISDGQIQAPNATIYTGTPLPYSGAASIPTFAAEIILAAGAVAYAMI